MDSPQRTLKIFNFTGIPASEIIHSGEYLHPLFNAKSLSNAQLAGILHFHGIAPPTPYKKQGLVDLFNNHIAAKRLRLVEERELKLRQSMTLSREEVEATIEKVDLSGHRVFDMQAKKEVTVIDLTGSDDEDHTLQQRGVKEVDLGMDPDVEMIDLTGGDV